MLPKAECLSASVPSFHGPTAGTSERGSVQNETASAGPPFPNADAIWELRMVCQLDFEQLARLLNTDRKELLFWASGGSMPECHERHLRRVVETMRKVDRGRSSNNLPLLLGNGHGEAPIELLRRGEYERVVTLLGVGPGRKPARRGTRSLEELRSLGLAPPPPWVLVDARHEKIHIDMEPVRVIGSLARHDDR